MLCIWWDQLGVVYYVPLKNGRSLLTAIVVFELSIEGKTATIRGETRQSNFATWQRSTTCCKTDQNLLRKAEMGGTTPPAVFAGHCSFQSITHGLSEQHFHSYEDTKKRLDSWTTSKDDFRLTWYSYAARNMGESSR